MGDESSRRRAANARYADWCLINQASPVRRTERVRAIAAYLAPYQIAGSHELKTRTSFSLSSTAEAMIRYTQQAKRCICEQHSDTHPEHAKHLIAHRGDFRCPHWDWATDERYRAELEEKAAPARAEAPIDSPARGRTDRGVGLSPMNAFRPGCCGT
jgi:hypothetical protein